MKVQLQVPSLTPSFLSAVTDWSYAEEDTTRSQRQVLGSKLEKELATITLPKVADGAIYRGINADTKTIHASLKSGRVKLDTRAYASWSRDSDCVSRFVDEQGLILQSSVSKIKPLVDLDNITTIIYKDPTLRSKYNDLMMLLDSEKEIVSKGAVTNYKIVGIIYTSEEIDGVLDDAGIEIRECLSTGNTYFLFEDVEGDTLKECLDLL
ncbi:hypothetical protein BN7874_024 [Phage NCTB]|nr:hypothetical protein BN7874_024 [Phage NCTB]